MKRCSPTLLSFISLLSACTSIDSLRVDSRNYAVDTYYPRPYEVRLAESRTRRYWQRNSTRFGPEPRYLLVAASALLPAELSTEFSIKLDHAETSGSYFTQGISSSSKQGIRGFVIFDTQTGNAAEAQGYILVDAPSQNQVVHVDRYKARYIGSGG
jgi:hypothetical protein